MEVVDDVKKQFYGGTIIFPSYTDILFVNIEVKDFKINTQYQFGVLRRKVEFINIVYKKMKSYRFTSVLNKSIQLDYDAYLLVELCKTYIKIIGGNINVDEIIGKLIKLM